MADVFVSYKAEDRRRVKPLVEALEMDGYSVWWDEQIGGGTAWRHSIEAELNAAKCVIVAWSKRSVQPEGAFVQDEATRAQQRHVYVPVLIDKVHLPLGFGETQALPLAGWKGDRSDPRFQAVRAAVNRLTGIGAGPQAKHQRPYQLSRRAVLGGGAVAVAAVGAVGTWTFLKSSSAHATGDSIAVLPFANLSGDAAQAYFSDGIAEELRSALARLAGLNVVGRTSSEAVRNDDAETAAKKLGVATILTGSVRRSPSTVRVSAQLIDGHTGLEKWSEDYDRTPGDSIKIQTDIAENVARALSVALGSVARAALTVGGTNNADAQNLALQANELTRHESKKGYARALELIDAALALDPNYAFAYGMKAVTLLGLYNAFAKGSDELAKGRAQALELANKAISIAPDLPIGHGALASIYAGNFQIARALVEYRRAFSLARSSPDAILSYSSFLMRLGDAGASLQLANEAIRLDPLNPSSYGYRAATLFFARRYAEGAKSLEDFKRASPDLFNSPTTLGNCLMMAGRVSDAAASYGNGPAEDPFTLTGRAVLQARTNNRTGALENVQRLQQLYGDAASYQYGQIFAQLGDSGAALSNLERGWAIKDAGLLSMKVDPWLDPIRAEPRFAALLSKMNFPG
jgi:TolB-like protein/Tfp pilus assembly protein PilF